MVDRPLALMPAPRACPPCPPCPPACPLPSPTDGDSPSPSCPLAGIGWSCSYAISNDQGGRWP
ncbi:hypothetical protein ACJIZ3_019366 [Penstemon smallii]|uniref:Uncharacterized protein n=1 Tax=Penstemon smallii TaxID=265156 RepID=A0ABD3T0Z8_9LAMI